MELVSQSNEEKSEIALLVITFLSKDNLRHLFSIDDKGEGGMVMGDCSYGMFLVQLGERNGCYWLLVSFIGNKTSFELDYYNWSQELKDYIDNVREMIEL